MAIITVNPGTNINTAAQTAGPGDIIELAPGNHTVQQVFLSPGQGHSNGTAANPITIRAQDPSNKPVLNSASRTAAHGTANGQFVLEDLDYWNVQNLKFDGFNSQGVAIHAFNRDTTGINVTGLELSNNTWTAGNTVTGYGGHPFMVAGKPNGSGTLRNVTVKDTTLYNVTTGTTFAYEECFTVAGKVDGVLIENCEVRDSQFAIAFNTLGSGDDPGSLPGWNISQPQNVTWRGNRAINIKGANNGAGACAGFYCDRALSNILWEENYTSGVKTGLFVGFEDPGFFGVNTIATNGIEAKNNVFIVGPGAGGYGGGSVVAIGLGSGRSETPVPTNMSFHNNVIILRGLTSFSGIVQMNRVDVANIYNNVFFEESNSDSAYFIGTKNVDDLGNAWVNPPNSANWSSSCNLWYSNVRNASVSGTFSYDYTGGTTYNGLTAWQGTGQDASSVVLAPSFVGSGENVAGYVLTNDPALACGDLGIVIGPIVAGFTASPSQLTVSFTNTSTADSGITSYSWNFGDGSGTSMLEDPTYTYAASGTYPVTLTVTGPDGTDFVTQNITVSVQGTIPSDPCDTNILTNGDFATGTAAGWLEFSNGSSTFDTTSLAEVVTVNAPNTNTQVSQSGLSIVSGQEYGLSFDISGTLATGINVSLFKNTAPFTNYGLYENINVTTTTANEEFFFTAPGTDTDARLMFWYVDSTGIVTLDNVCFGPITYTVPGVIDANYTHTVSDLTANFTDTSTSTSGINTWLWDFGDGNTSSAQNPSHTYGLAGTYTVLLTVTGSDGTDSFSQQVTVTTPPVATNMPSALGLYVIDTNGNVTLLSSHPSWINLFPTIDQNLIGEIEFSYNVFSGYGQAIEPCSGNILQFNIDTGNYRVVDCVGAVQSAGNDPRLAIYGAAQPIDPTSGLATRGAAYWAWYQNDQNALYGYTIDAWPALLATQFSTAGAL